MEIPGTLIAPGTAIVDSKLEKRQLPTGGIVGKHYVHDGDQVRAGDILAQLGDLVPRANLAIAAKGLTELSEPRKTVQYFNR